MSSSEFRRVTAEQALAFIFSACEQDRPYTLFDTRDLASYARAHLPTAQTLLEREVGSWLGRLPRSQPVIIYCYHGFSSQTFAKTFADFGFAEVYSVDGGFDALVHALQHAREAAMREPRKTEASQA